MSTFYSQGYKPPKGVTSASQVKTYQRMLGVKADGVWGPKTQAAYDLRKTGKTSLYSPPSGIERSDQIKTMQGVLGVETDGIWGEKTQAAYDMWHNGKVSSDAFVAESKPSRQKSINVECKSKSSIVISKTLLNTGDRIFEACTRVLGM